MVYVGILVQKRPWRAKKVEDEAMYINNIRVVLSIVLQILLNPSGYLYEGHIKMPWIRWSGTEQGNMRCGDRDQLLLIIEERNPTRVLYCISSPIVLR